MKNLTRLVVFALIALTTVTAFAQKKGKKFTGTINYTIESVGTTPIPINTNEQAVKVLENRVSFNNGMVLVNDRIIYQLQDLSQIEMMIQQSGASFDYDGPWKIFLKNEVKQSSIDSLDLNDNYKITYLDDTKTIADITAKKAKIMIKDEDGETTEYDVWYAENMGPEYDFLFVPGLKGFPLEFVQDLGNDMAIKWTAKEITNKKLKETEFLLPAGYQEITPEKFQDFLEKWQEFMEDMQF